MLKSIRLMGGMPDSHAGSTQVSISFERLRRTERLRSILDAISSGVLRSCALSYENEASAIACCKRSMGSKFYCACSDAVDARVFKW